MNTDWRVESPPRFGPTSRESARRVLVVEDDLATLFALERLFQRQGWDVSSSRTIETALVQLESPPDWIVLDLGLADGNGEDVLRYVRERRLPSHVAVVSGLLGPASLPGLKELRPDALLEKPIHFEDLLNVCGITAPDSDPPKPPNPLRLE